MNRLIVCLAVAGLLIAPAVMKAQTGTATISGAITDPTGAAIADAMVTVRNVNTGIERVVKTNQQGLYVVDRLLPGEYEIIVEKPGFKRFARREVVLQIDQRARHDIALEIGAVQEVIEVTAGAAQFLKPESSELSQVIEEDTVEELPLNGRNTFELIALNSGVGTTTNSFFKGIGIDLSLNGQRPSTNNFLIGGMDNIEFISNAPNNTVQPDAVAEFNVLTNNFSAEYGRAVGGVVNLQMRSGTNEFHGTLFEFLRNDVLDATDFFTNKAGEKKNPFRFNQFGGTLGGPIVKNRTFFFAGYQGTWISTSNTALLSVPPLAWRSGDFSSLLADGIQIYDPTTVVGTIGIFPIRAAFPGNIIPAASQNPVGRAILDLYPAPNRPGTFQNYVTPLGSETKTSDIDVKVDHKFTDNHFIAGRMNLTDFKLEQDSFFGDIGGGGSFPKQLTDNLNLGFTYTSILSPSVLNEFRFGYLRRKNDVISSGFGQNLNEQLGIPGLNVSEETSGLAWICPIGFDCLGGQPFFPQLVTITSHNFMDTVSLTRGRHSFKVGANFFRRGLNLFQAGFPRGLFLTDALMTSQLGAGGNTVASLLVGYPFFFLRDVLDHFMNQRSWEMGAFFQDDIRVSSRLTLNLGIRYDYFSPPVEKDDLQANFNIQTGAMDLAGQNGVPRGLINPDRNNWAPRFGFAYALTEDDRTVLRGGYGISYFAEQNALATLDRSTYNIPFYFQQSLFQFSLLTPTQAISDGLPPPPTPDPSAPFGKVGYRDPNLRDAYVQFWNLNIQRELTSTLLLDLAYAGSHGVKLLGIRNPNQPPPGPVAVFPVSPAIGLLFTMESRATSAYHAFQVKMNKRWSEGLTFLGTYTWGKSTDDSVGYWPNTGQSQLPQDSREFSEPGLSDWDVRHRATFNYIWQVPVGRGRRFLPNAGGVVQGLLGGWELTGIFVARTGTPFSPTISVNQANTAFGGEQRPDRLGDGNLDWDERTVDRWFDVDAFALPELFTFGNSGRNILTGPGFVNMDLGIYKNFYFGERAQLQFRTEFFNLTNTPHFGLPNRAIDLPQAGTITTLVAPPRQIQFGLKLLF